LPAETLGLIAGNGHLPLALARAAHRAGYRVAAVAHQGETDPGLEAEVDSLEWVRLGQLGKIADALRREGVRRIVMAGGLDKAAHFSHWRPDLTALRLLATLSERGDDRILRTIAAWFEEQGLTVVAPSDLLADHFAGEGLLVGVALTEREQADVARGVEVARLLGTADIGQTVVLREGVVLAVEAMEGTDACIRRGGAIAEGSIVVKTCKPKQDRRFDLPSIGPGTLRVMADSRARVLAVEAGLTLVLETEETFLAARRAKVSIVGIR
jgi:DUF1009 family protein